MNSVDVIIVGIGDLVIVFINGIDIGSIKGFDFVMCIDIIQFKLMLQCIYFSGKICFIGCIYISGIQVNNCVIFWVSFLIISGYGKIIVCMI